MSAYSYQGTWQADPCSVYPLHLATTGVIQVSATTLDDVWFPLIKKKGLNKKPVAAQASVLSDLSARYKIVPRASQLSQAAQVKVLSSIIPV